MLLLTRSSVLLFSTVATLMACLRSNIYELVGESSILSLVSLFAPLVFGLYWKRTSSTGAVLSMFAGFMIWFALNFFYDSQWPSLVPATIISFLTLIVGSLIWKDTATGKSDN
jgi:solute:Na+ symporter, SSS family